MTPNSRLPPHPLACTTQPSILKVDPVGITVGVGCAVGLGVGKLVCSGFLVSLPHPKPMVTKSADPMKQENNDQGKPVPTERSKAAAAGLSRLS